MKSKLVDVLGYLLAGGAFFSGCAGPVEPVKKAPAVAEARQESSGEGEWGSLEAGLRTRLTCLEESWAPGRPLRIRIEVENASGRAETYDDQQVDVNDPFEVVGPGGRRVPWIGGSVQTMGHPKRIEPGERRVLLDEFDLNGVYLLTEEGVYTVRFRQQAGFGSASIPASNVMTVRTSGEARISPERAFLERLSFCTPERWEISRQERHDGQWIVPLVFLPPSGLKRDVVVVSIFCVPESTRPEELVPSPEALPEYLGVHELGHVYVLAGEGAEAQWPGFRRDIASSLAVR